MQQDYSQLPSDRFRIVIVGAGIAGLVAARMLREEGREIIVLESSSFKQELGAAIHLQPNAAGIMMRYGLDPVLVKSVKNTGYVEYNKAGDILKRWDVDTEKELGVPHLMNHRADLHNECRRLAESPLVGVAAPAIVICSARVVDVDCEAGVIKTADGRIFKGHLIIGADGIRSGVRTAVLGKPAEIQPTGISAYRCIIPMDKILHIPKVQELEARPCMTLIYADEYRLAFYLCRNKTLLNCVAFVPDKNLGEESKESWSAPGNVDEMVKCFEGFPDWAVEVLKAVEPEQCGLFSLRDQDPLPHWVKGCTIITGDAAHPMLPHQGQGGAMAVETAEAIAYFFRDVKGPISSEEVNKRLIDVFKCRYKRASAVALDTRAKSKPHRGKAVTDSKAILWNWSYKGAEDWLQKMKVKAEEARAAEATPI